MDVLRSAVIFTLILALQPAVLRVCLFKCLIKRIASWLGPYINLNKVE